MSGDDDSGAGDHGAHRVQCHLDAVLRARHMTLAELSRRAGISVVNLSVLKNDRARAVRFFTLTALCDALSCQPGDLFTITAETSTDVAD